MPLKRSCLECRRRKIKCTRTQPCEYCTKLDLRCAYPARKPRPALEDDDVLSGRSAKELFSRIANLEKLLEQSIASNKSVSNETIADLDQTPRDPNDVQKRALICGKDDMTQNELARRKITTHHGIRGIWENEGKAFCQVPTSWEPPFAQSLSATFTIPLVGTPAEYQCFLPPAGSILPLWQAYLDHVDPVLRLIHGPTVQRDFTRALSQPQSMPPDMAALVFACLFGAQASSPYHRATSRLFDPLGSSRVLHQLHCGVQTALTAADYMRIPSMTTLQALTLYLACARQYLDPNLAWTLCGVARQLAVKLGLDREPSLGEFTLFECEMRKRLWWHICVLDIRIAERAGLEPSLHESSLQVTFPAMVDDNQIYPDIKALPNPPRPVAYDTLYCTLRFELAAIARRFMFSSAFNNANGYRDRPAAECVEELQTLQRTMEEKYFANVPDNIPVIELCRASMKILIARYRLILRYNFRDDKGNPEATNREENIKSALFIMECVRRLRRQDSQLRVWWHPQEYLEWDAAAVVMREVASGGEDVQSFVPEATAAINTFFLTWKHSPSSLAARRERWAYLVRLYNEAFRSKLSTGKSTALLSGVPAPKLGNPRQSEDSAKGGTTISPTQEPVFDFLSMPLEGSWANHNYSWNPASFCSPVNEQPCAPLPTPMFDMDFMTGANELQIGDGTLSSNQMLRSDGLGPTQEAQMRSYDWDPLCDLG